MENTDLLFTALGFGLGMFAGWSVASRPSSRPAEPVQMVPANALLARRLQKHSAPCFSQGDCEVVLLSAGSQKINVMKELRGILKIGLNDAKNIVELENSVVMTGVDQRAAEAIRRGLECAGATVEIRRLELSKVA